MRSIHLEPVSGDVDIFDTYRRFPDLYQLKYKLPLPAAFRHPLGVMSPHLGLHFNESVNRVNRLKPVCENHMLLVGSEAAFILNIDTQQLTPVPVPARPGTCLIDAHVHQSSAFLLFSDGVLVSSAFPPMTFTDAACIEAVPSDGLVLLRVCPVHAAVKFLLVDVVNQRIRKEFLAKYPPRHVAVQDSSIFLVGRAPVWSADVLQPDASDDEEERTFISRLEVQTEKVTHHWTEHATLSTTGNFIAVSYFVESAAVLELPTLKHVMTLPGIAYIAESRAQIKFLAVSDNFTALCESTGCVSVFKKPVPGAQIAESASLQEHAHEEIIMGIHLTDAAIFVLTEKQLTVFATSP